MRLSAVPLPGRLALLCMFGFLISFATFYPGYLSSDTFDQFGQALSGQYRTWHPPVMAFVWHVLNFIHKGPQIMLALQLFFIWMSCYLIASAMTNFYWRLVILLLFVVAPFTQNFSGWILKDTQMTFSWLLAAAIMFKSYVTGKKPGVLVTVAVALLITYGTWLRYNAVVAVPPLCLVWAYMAFPYAKRFAKWGYAVGLFLVIFFGHDFFNLRLLKAAKEDTDIQIYFHDISGVFVKYGKNYYLPEMYSAPDFDTAYIRAHYNQVDVTALLWNPDNKQVLPYNLPNITQNLRAAWLKMIKEEPGLYFRHRMDIYEYFLGFKKQAPTQYFFAWIVENPYGYFVADSFLYNIYLDYMKDREDQLIFQVWFWVFLNVLLLPLVFLIRNVRSRLYYICIVASGVLYTLPQFMVANTVRDFRYIYWACFACIIGVAMLAAEKILERRVRKEKII